MSTPDTMVPLVSAPWFNGAGAPLPVTPLPGLRPEVIQGLESSYPGILNAEMRNLLRASCGLSGTALGSIDFTAQWYPEEPIAVFRPCLTLAADDAGRRWIAEGARDEGLPGPVWCIFAKPQVAVYVADDLAGFLSTLRKAEESGEPLQWLRGLSAEARAVWAHRCTLAHRSLSACRRDLEIRGWLVTLPGNTYIHDLRRPAPARGWPYGLAGPTGQFYRCGRLPIFAVAQRPALSRRPEHSTGCATTEPAAGDAHIPGIVVITQRHRHRTSSPFAPHAREVRRCA